MKPTANLVAKFWVILYYLHPVISKKMFSDLLSWPLQLFFLFSLKSPWNITAKTGLPETRIKVCAVIDWLFCPLHYSKVGCSWKRKLFGGKADQTRSIPWSAYYLESIWICFVLLWLSFKIYGILNCGVLKPLGHLDKAYFLLIAVSQLSNYALPIRWPFIKAMPLFTD